MSNVEKSVCWQHKINNAEILDDNNITTSKCDSRLKCETIRSPTKYCNLQRILNDDITQRTVNINK